MDGIIGSIQAVSLPVFASQQERKLEIYKNSVREILNISYLIIFPFLLGIVAISRPLIRLLLTDKWIDSVPYLQIFALNYMVHPTQIICAEALKGLGLSKITLKIEYFRKTFEIGLLLCLLKYGPYKIAIGGLIAETISLIISIYPNIKYLHYSLKEQIEDILKPLIAAIIMSFIVLFIEKLSYSVGVILVLQIISGIIIYIINCYLLKIESFNMIMNIIKNKINQFWREL